MSEHRDGGGEHGSVGASGDGVGELERQRRANLESMVGLGVSPYGGRIEGLVSLAEARSMYDAGSDGSFKAAEAARKDAEKSGESFGEVVDERPRVRVAGRVVLKREGGKLIWLQLRDHTTGPASVADVSRGGKRDEGADGGSGETVDREGLAVGVSGGLSADLQVAVSKRDVEGPGFEVAKLLDLGDVVVAEGPLMKTNRGEVTVWASGLTVASKSLVPPPEKWAGLKDVEQRYRKRYVDLWANPGSMRVFELRSLIVGVMRRELGAMGFCEVETPMLQSQAGGAAARPFVTHMNALGMDLYMRIAPELYLKRVLVGGMPRVFEINRNFRNEGLDKQHNPEFTMLELYEAFGDVGSVMGITERLLRSCAGVVSGELGLDAGSMPFGDVRVDWASDFRRVTYRDLFEEALGFSMDDEGRVRGEAEERGIARKYRERLAGEGRGGGEVDALVLVNELFEEVAEASLDPGEPTWIMEYPSALSPLTRAKAGDPSVAERSDLFVGGMEVGPHYTELNDPDVQAARFREQLSGLDDEESTFRSFDEDFIEALKVGMPPAGGMGLGIDRVCMLLLDQPTIRDVVLFPMMRRLEG